MLYAESNREEETGTSNASNHAMRKVKFRRTNDESDQGGESGDKVMEDCPTSFKNKHM